jgi:hypothetical protein
MKKFVLVGDLRNVKHNYDYIDEVNITYARCKYIYLLYFLKIDYFFKHLFIAWSKERKHYDNRPRFIFGRTREIAGVF